MTESFVETQVRLLLERQCSDVFFALLRRLEAVQDAEITLVVFDFGGGNVAFKTMLNRDEIVTAFEILLDHWLGGGRSRQPVPGVDAELLKLLGDQAKRLLPAGIGFILLLGSGDRTAYISTAERSDVVRMVETELLPMWRGEARGAN